MIYLLKIFTVFDGERIEGMACNLACWCILTIFRKRLVYGHGLLFFLILAVFWLSETGQIWGFRAFPGECMQEMALNFACWSGLPSELIKLRRLENPYHWGNGLKFCLLMYPNHLKNWLDYDHSLLICIILRYFDLMKRVKFGVSGHFGHAL